MFKYHEILQLTKYSPVIALDIGWEMNWESKRRKNKKKNRILHGVIYFRFCFVFRLYRETDVKGVSTFSKCNMYDVNWTTIQSWDLDENWNSTRHHEKLNVLGKYWQVTKLNKRTIETEKRHTKNNNKKNESQEITFAL